MPKCDVAIAFDRPSRKFVGGEIVAGVVSVEASDDVSAGEVSLKSFWETHGRGNRDRGPVEEVVLAENVNVRSGERRTYPFQVRAPQGPPTYHGSDLNIDHYLEAEVDVAWARNPKCREDFLLDAGPDFVPPEPGDRQSMYVLTEKTMMWKPGAAVLCAAIVVFLFVLPAIAFILTAIAGFIYVRRRMLDDRLGDISLQATPEHVHPGTPLTLRLDYRAARALTVKRATVRLVGNERCTSGSGTNRTTRVNTLHEDEHEIEGHRDLLAGEQVTIAYELRVPKRAPYSFEAKNNSVRWTVEARIDIPNCPDWTGSIPMVVAPPKPHDASAPGDAIAPFAPEGLPDEVPTVPGVAPEPSRPAGHVSGVGTDGTEDLLALAETIQSTGRYSDERDRLLDGARGREFTLDLEAENTEWTSSYDLDEFKDGRSVVGTIDGTPVRVRVRFKRPLNDTIDTVRSGDRIRLRAVFTGWDRLLDRAELDAITLEGRSPGR